MLIAAHHSMFGGAEKAQYVGVTLTGTSVTLTNGVLSNFANDSYAMLPIVFSSMNKPWEAVSRFVVTSLTGTVYNGALYGGVGTFNGWTPMYLSGTAGGRPYISAFLNGIGWAVVWDSSDYTSISTLAGAVYELNTEKLIKTAWDGYTYTMSEVNGNNWRVSARKTSSTPVSGLDLPIQMGTNRGQSYPLRGSIDLNYCYIRYDGKLLWEGVAGAYQNVKRLVAR